MTLPPFEWFMLGAAAGWVVCALCFWAISAWRDTPRLMLMDDEELVQHSTLVKRELLYRFPDSHSSGEVK